MITNYDQIEEVKRVYSGPWGTFGCSVSGPFAGWIYILTPEGKWARLFKPFPVAGRFDINQGADQ